MPVSISPADPRRSFATMKFEAGESTAVSAAASKNTQGPSPPLRSKCAQDHVPPNERRYGRPGHMEKPGQAEQERESSREMSHWGPLLAELDGVQYTRSEDPQRVQLPGQVPDEDGVAGDGDAAVERGSRAVRPENLAVCGIECRNEIA